MLHLPHCILNRATAAGFIGAITFIVATTVAAAASADGFNSRSADDSAVLGQRDEQFSTPNEPRSDTTVYADLFWPFNQLFGSPVGQKNRGQSYIRSRDIFGNPGPTYRVLGVVRNKTKKRVLSEADQLKLDVAQKLRLAPPAPLTKGPLLLSVSIRKQTVTLFDAGVAIDKSPVSTGTPSHPTPTGVFSVTEKEWWHRSNLYSLAPMPLMQRITWSGVALHAGELPGYAASHGCVRLPYDFAIRLWETTRIGVKVIITDDEVAPIEIAHARLFAPLSKAEPAPEPKPTPNAPPEQITPPKKNSPAEDAPVSENAPTLPNQNEQAFDIVSDTEFLEADSDAGQGPRVIVFADAMAQSIARHRAADEDEADDYDAAMAVLQQVELIDPDNTVINGTVELAVVRSDQPPQIFFLSVEKVIDEPGRQPASVPDPSVVLASLDESTLPATNSGKFKTRLASQSVAVPFWTPERVLRPGPISVLVSRKDQRMYVRKGFEPLFDAPVAITKSDQPIGTHVFTAVALSDDQATMRWMVASLSTASSTVERGRVVPTRAQGIERSAAKPTAAAISALDRLDLPQDAVERISQLMSVGASLIVTDSGLGRDAAAFDTDFTILTH
jgi:lipoprotein-anchoring transpeptidase ErfK/SrfK